MWYGCPKAVHEATRSLRYNSLVNVMLGMGEDRGYPYTALYVPDPGIPFHRVSFPKAFSRACAPAGMASMMVESTCREGDAVWAESNEAIAAKVIRHLGQMGFLDPAKVMLGRVVRHRYAYPIYDLAYFRTVETLRETVSAAGVRLLGRFAEFDYINVGTCVERAIAMAETLGDRGELAS